MDAHPLSFSEVLEDEYRYFHGEVRYREVTFELKHVREIEDLDKRLAFHRHADGRPSRWKVLAEAVSTYETDRAEAVVRGLNQLLTRQELLEVLLVDEYFVWQVLEPAVRRALLRVPIARRMLFESAKIRATIVSDPDLIGEFAARSAAIRILNAHVPQIFTTEPALLALIADDEVLDREVARDPHTIASRLLELFPPSPPRTFVQRARRYSAGEQKEEMERAETEDRRLDPGTLREKLGILSNENDPPPHSSIPQAELSRFNAILVEIAYADYVSEGLGVRAIYMEIHEKEHAALCLSGGSIRRASFNLGVLQGMADHRMLNRVHYISTVSSGGYIGSWLSSWIRRHAEGAVGVAKDLSHVPTNPLQPEIEPIRHLREYSSYLVPRLTALSLDSWTLVTTYIRNVFLNWTMLLPTLAAALALPRLLEAFVISTATFETTERWGWGSLIAATLAVMVIGMMRPASELPASERDRQRRKRALWFWLSPLIVSAFFFCAYWANPDNIFNEQWWILPAVFAAGSVFGALLFGYRFGFQSADDASAVVRRATVEVVAAGASGAFAGCLLLFTFKRLFPPSELAVWMNLEIYVCLSVPLYLLVFFVQSTLLVGLTTTLSADYDREWWARSAAAVFVYCVLHAGASFAVLLLPVFIRDIPNLTAPIGGLSAIGSWLLSRNWKSGTGKNAAAKLTPLLRLAATITLLFVVAAIAMLTSGLLGWANSETPETSSWHSSAAPLLKVPIEWTIPRLEPLPAYVPEGLNAISRRYVEVLRGTRPLMLWAFLFAAVVLAWYMSSVLDVNIYSIHGMYRNRLIRAYLGASRWSRTPDPFTGFDPQDNIEMWNLRPQCLWQTSFINFEQFAADLASMQWWRKPNLDWQRNGATLLDVEWAREIVNKFNAATPDEKKEWKPEAMAAVIYTVNGLMRCCDLANNVPAPRTVQLLANNRTYLEWAFETSLKKHRHQAPHLDASVPLLSYPKATMPKGKEVPPALRKDDHENARDKDPLLEVPPLHVINASLNLVGGEKLAWQERQAASFTMTPLHSGSRSLDAYCDTADYGDKITLGTAMAISGTPVSPSVSALSSPSFTFLMTFFSVRLGRWVGNPARRAHGQASPRMSLLSLLLEAFGKTNASYDYVYLSDGGHFENLGLYEMVLRRCRHIIVCDASSDDKDGFGDLANGLRKIRIDLGVPIELLVTRYIGPQKDQAYGHHWALGKIHYRNIDGGDAVGYLVYVKPEIHSDRPADVRKDANESTSFPRETTDDSEAQFESYRALGHEVIGRICGDSVEERTRVAPNVPTFFANAWAYLNAVEPPPGDKPITTKSTLPTKG